jgi:hypothetical protein
MFSAIVFLLLAQMSSRKFGQYLVSCVHLNTILCTCKYKGQYLVSCVHVNTKDSIYICYVFSDGKWAHVERL